jgi:hypothetical protein
MPLFQDVGNSNLAAISSNTIGTMVNLKSMQDKATLEREKFALEKPILEAEGAISQQKVQQMKAENERRGKKIPFAGGIPGLDGLVLPEGKEKIASIMQQTGRGMDENGMVTVGSVEDFIQHDYAKNPLVQKAVDQEIHAKLNYDFQKASEEFDKAKKDYEKDKSDPEKYKALTGAMQAKAAAQDRIGTVSTNLEKMRSQLLLSETYHDMASDPAMKRLIDEHPEFQIAVKMEDPKAALKVLEDISKHKVDMADKLKIEQFKGDVRLKVEEARTIRQEKIAKMKEASRAELLRMKEASIENRKKMGKDTTPEAKQKRLSQIAIEKAKLFKQAGDPDLNPDVKEAMGALNEEADSLRESLGKPKKQESRVKEGVSYLKRAEDRGDAIKKIKSLSERGWSREDLEAAAKEAGWE